MLTTTARFARRAATTASAILLISGPASTSGRDWRNCANVAPETGGFANCSTRTLFLRSANGCVRISPVSNSSYGMYHIKESAGGLDFEGGGEFYSPRNTLPTR